MESAPGSARVAKHRDASDRASPRGVPFAQALRFWVKLGFISFGGPAGQIAIMHRELVDRRRWVSERRFLHALNYCMLLPGPEAQQLATYIGWLLHRTLGGLVAGAFFVIPSIFVLLALSYVYAAYGSVAAVADVFRGFKPVVAALVVEAVFRIGRRALKGPVHVAIAAAAFVAIHLLHLPFPGVVLGAGLVGFLCARFEPRRIISPLGSSPAPPAAENETGGSPADSAVVVDDDALPLAHEVPSGRRALGVLAVGLALWLVPILALAAWQGRESLFVQEYRFFTTAALVTFGGAYSVLSYVTQAAVEQFGWITQAQAIDGLALAETTPGPLIMVLQFVGFMAGWNHPVNVGQTASAVVAALVATYTTFLPSFVFIFLGAPYVERARRNETLGAALAGVTAAVVGVIASLALVFGYVVLWPRGWDGGVDGFAVLLGVAAFVALHRFRVNVLWVVLAAGAAGFAHGLLA
ncbi:MAG TPA: chromate efflux transporter [Candidatus Krumholzibacteria bacterium]|nr:chromate efflux transporter [Candidatus Krumholzibacteria bacterium]